MRGLVVMTCLAGMLACGCSQPVEQDAAATAVAFATAPPDRACALLAPATLATLEADAGTGCAQALPGIKRGIGGTVVAVEVAGESAQVKLDDDVVFLAHFAGGWRVIAAGCARTSPDRAIPYDCEVEP